VTGWTPKYDNAQRGAIEYAYAELRVRPASRIVAMAAAGELRDGEEGERIPAFEVPLSSAVNIGKLAERRRAGQIRAKLKDKAPRDRAELLQARLTCVIDLELERLERRLKAGQEVDPDRFRGLARALKELATIPDPQERRLPRALGESSEHSRTDSHASTDSLAGAILAASDASVSPSVRDGMRKPNGGVP
jgi:hypothetical protein